MVNPAADSTWRLLDVSYPSPFRNLALEETLARGDISETFRSTVRLWNNPPAAIVGRFQNVSDEVDADFCERNCIQIARRFTGGGAVFQDEGNLNFTVVTRRPGKINLTEYCAMNASPILDLLSKFDLAGAFVPPNSIHVANKKISGAAAAFTRNLALWHASILVSTNTSTLQRVLSPSQPSAARIFVRSKWHPVTTLKTALGRSIEVEDVKARLLESFEKLNDARFESNRLSKQEEGHISLLLDRKYLRREWNYRGVCGEELLAA